MRFGRVLTTAMVAGVLAFTPAAAFAGSQLVGGGIWNYGTSAGAIYSHYLHNTQCHGASVHNGKLLRGTSSTPGAWATGHATAGPSRAPQASWHKCA